jgi:hypothetical protein
VGGNVTLPSFSYPIILNGSGTIRPAGSGISLTDVIVSSGSVISIEGLTITTSLTLRGSSALSAVEGSQIELENETVNLVLEVEGISLPTLKLGNIGEDYSIVPRSMRVLGLRAEIGRTTLVSGKTLSNCEEWRVLVELGRGEFTTECVTVSSGRLLEEPRVAAEIALVLVPIDASSPESNSANVGVIVGVVVGVVVVVAVVGVVGFILIKKKGSSGSSGGGSPPTGPI